jgi:Holliday junction resolvase RusA-like endonuclease
MTLLYNVFVEGEPKAQPRPRKGKWGNFYNPPTADAWKQTVQAAFLARGGKPAIQGRAIIKIHFFFHKAAGLGGKITPKTTKPDADNLWKPVMDALTEIGVWKDDCQVDTSGIERFWTPGKSGARIWIEADDDAR